MSEVNCANCIVGEFKDSLCEKEFCEKFKCARESKGFIEHVLEVARPRGEWEKVGDKIEAYDIVGHKTWGQKRRCTRCGFIKTYIEDFGIYPFCPSCGCDTRDKKDDLAEIIEAVQSMKGGVKRNESNHHNSNYLCNSCHDLLDQ